MKGGVASRDGDSSSLGSSRPVAFTPLPFSEVTSMSTELAYMAGFFDGEGSLGVWGRKHRYFAMSLPNSNREILDLFHTRFGGSVSRKVASALSKKEMWCWKIQGDAAWEAYYALRPYLREKLWKDEPVG